MSRVMKGLRKAAKLASQENGNEFNHEKALAPEAK